MIQDNSHVSSIAKAEDDAVEIGDNVYVGANTTLDCCELESFSYVGMGATIGSGSVV